MSDNLSIYNALKQPPKEALRAIQGGRLAGKTDINPQWRYKALTEQFGPCGIGWKYEITRVFSEPASEGQVFAFAEVQLFIKQEEWSDPIPGYGGSMLVEKEKAGLHSSDEGYKMAITDALSAAMKMIGVAADVYAGLWDGTKYNNAPRPREETGQDSPHDEPETHWCSTHETAFFKRGKMKSYAHPIKDEAGNDTGEWCNEHKSTEASKEELEHGTIVLGANPTLKVQNITELKGLMSKHTIPTHEAYEVLNLNKSFSELTITPDEAWRQIKAAKGIE